MSPFEQIHGASREAPAHCMATAGGPTLVARASAPGSRASSALTWTHAHLTKLLVKD